MQPAIGGGIGVQTLALLAAWCVTTVPSLASAGWTDNLRLTLANYAYYKSTNLPQDFMCTSLGNAAECCNCWNSRGDHNSGQNNDYCNQPPNCLAKKVKHSGGFKYARIKNPGEITDLLQKWNVPQDMRKEFETGAYFDSANFATFSLTVTNKGTGKTEAHVGAARRGKKYSYVGWTYGQASADLITPRIRTARSGDCKCKRPYCTSRQYPCPESNVVPNYSFTAGTKKRGFRSSEVARINDGLLAYSFSDAATQADRGRRLLRSAEEGDDPDEGFEGSQYVPFTADTLDNVAGEDEDPDGGFEGAEYQPFTLDAPENVGVAKSIMGGPKGGVDLELQEAQ